MSGLTTIWPQLGVYREEQLQPVNEEFDAGIVSGELTDELARRYMRTLELYSLKIDNTTEVPNGVNLDSRHTHDARTEIVLKELVISSFGSPSFMNAAYYFRIRTRSSFSLLSKLTILLV
jgi:hypothetical protein